VQEVVLWRVSGFNVSYLRECAQLGSEVLGIPSRFEAAIFLAECKALVSLFWRQKYF
jgi:hypothetical protein